jgi:uncharacterized SAM-binding protein YcdF (DUF218 family)
MNMKKLLAGIKILVIGGVIYCAALGTLISAFGIFTKPQKSDCIIILGCQVRGETPSRFLIERTDKAIELYNNGYAKYIIASGGKGPGEDISEAEAMRRYMLSKGIDESAIIMEDKSASTLENLHNSKAIMDKMGLGNAVVISNKYHLKRASVMAKRAGIEGCYAGIFVPRYILNEIMGFLREIPAITRLYILGR